MVFNNALNFLNGRERRKFANNTYFERLNDDCIGVLCHETYIVKIYSNQTVKLNTGGWNTWLTRNRINRVLRTIFNNFEMYVFSKNGDMYLNEGRRATRIQFFDQMLLNTAGRCVNYWNRE